MSTTVQFYFSIATNSAPTNTSLHVEFSPNSFPFTGDIQSDCTRADNLYTTWEISGASGYWKEYCPTGKCDCAGGTTNRTCTEDRCSNAGCSGRNVSWRNCDCGQTSDKTVQFSYKCYRPSPNMYFPNPAEGPTLDSYNNNYVIYKVKYARSQFDPSNVSQLKTLIENNQGGCTSSQQNINNQNLESVLQFVCNNTSAANNYTASKNVNQGYCATYCRVGTDLTSKCKDALAIFCQNDNLKSQTICSDFCANKTDHVNNCNTQLLAYCNNPSNFTSSICTDFLDNSRVDNKLTADATTVLQTQCKAYTNDEGTDVKDPTTFPYEICGCFLPKSVTDAFYNKMYAINPSLQGFLNKPQCDYPYCANPDSIHPEQGYTCPDNVLTTCINNITIGSQTGGSINAVNNCVADSSPSDGSSKDTSTTSSPSTPGKKDNKTVFIVIAIVVLIVVIFAGLKLFKKNPVVNPMKPVGRSFVIKSTQPK